MRVRPHENYRQFPHLSPEREYCVIGLDHESFRVVDDKGEPILFPKHIFSITDESIPEDWVWDRFGDDEYYANPPELHAPGFYEDYFEGREEARQQLETYAHKAGIVRPV